MRAACNGVPRGPTPALRPHSDHGMPLVTPLTEHPPHHERLAAVGGPCATRAGPHGVWASNPEHPP